MTLELRDPPWVFDPASTAGRLQEGIALAVQQLRRRGAVVAVSGGVDSGVVAALCVLALGPERVVCLRLPEHDLGERSADLGLELARHLGTRTHRQSISPALEALGCYAQQHEAVRQVFADYEQGWPFKLVRSAPTGGVIVFICVFSASIGLVKIARTEPAVVFK